MIDAALHKLDSVHKGGRESAATPMGPRSRGPEEAARSGASVALQKLWPGIEVQAAFSK